MRKLIAFEFTTQAQASCRLRHPGRGEERNGDAAHAGRYVAALLDRARGQAGHVLQDQRTGPEHLQCQRGYRRCGAMQAGAVKGKGKMGKDVKGKP